eukprot:gene4131-5885_t
MNKLFSSNFAIKNAIFASSIQFNTRLLARCLSSIEPDYDETTNITQKKLKHKVPQKRASKLLNILRQEELEKLKAGRQFPDIKAGDSIAIEMLPFMTSKTSDTVKGLVIKKVNRASDTSVTILNVENGTPLERHIVLYSPLVKNVTILQKAFLHKGKKRVRRSKIYYVSKLHPENFTVK